MRVLVANEPRSYREIFAAAFRHLRPRTEARAVEPRDLDGEAVRVRPDLVICDRVTAAVETAARFWIEYRVENGAIVVASNVPTTVTTPPLSADNLGLDDLLSVIDRIEKLGMRNGRVRGTAGGSASITSITRSEGRGMGP